MDASNEQRAHNINEGLEVQAGDDVIIDEALAVPGVEEGEQQREDRQEEQREARRPFFHSLPEAFLVLVEIRHPVDGGLRGGEFSWREIRI